MFLAIDGDDLEGRESERLLLSHHTAAGVRDKQDLVLVLERVRENLAAEHALYGHAYVVSAVVQLGDLDAVRVRHLLVVFDRRPVDLRLVSVRQRKFLTVIRYF